MIIRLNNRMLTHSLSEPMLFHHIVKLRHPGVRLLLTQRSNDTLLRRSSVLSAVIRANFNSLYDEGGALDSQSSETQFMEHLVGRGESYIVSITEYILTDMVVPQMNLILYLKLMSRRVKVIFKTQVSCCAVDLEQLVTSSQKLRLALHGKCIPL